MRWSFFQQTGARYWLRVYLLYIAFEACVQLFFYLTLNIFKNAQISDIEMHFLMWVFQCVFVLPIWGVAYLFKKKNTWIQVVVNIAFFVAYTFFWYGPVMEWLASLHVQLQSVTQPNNPDKIIAIVDTWSAFYYQVLKHSLRLGWFFVADFFYHYKKEEKQRLDLLVANKELQLNLIKWHLNPDFYFKTINTIAARAKESPAACSGLILNLSKVMEFVIYRARERFIPVTEELVFLENYINLQNLGNEPGKAHMIYVSGEYSHLKIIPLLLVSLLEDHLQKNKNGSRIIGITFSEQSMRLSVPDMHSQKNGSPHPSLQMRLEEFYSNKYQFADDSPGSNWFEIQLNEIR